MAITLFPRLQRIRRSGRVALSLLPLVLLGGCEVLKARSLAQDGVEKYRNGDVKGAAELFERAAQLEPQMPVIQLNRGYTHLSLFQLSPKTKEGAQAASIAIDAFKKYMALPVKPEQRSKARDYLLQTFADAQKYDEAVEFFKPLVEKSPPDIEALTILGNIAKSIGKTSEARSWLEKRVAANPKDADGYVALAIMDWEELCNDTQCRLPPERRQPQQLPPDKRIEIANRGIEYAKKAVELSPNAPTPLVYWNLLLRERQYGYVPAVIDIKDKQYQEKTQAEQDRVNKLKTDDLAEAQRLMLKALEMQKAAKGADAPKPGEPAKPAAEPAKPAEPAKSGEAQKDEAAKPAAAPAPSTPPAAPEKK